MLKAKLTKAEFDALSEELKKAYKTVGDAYLLDAEGVDDVGELRRAKDRAAQLAKELKEENDRLKQEAEAGEELTAKKKGDIETLEKSWKSKLDKANADNAIKVTELTKHVQSLAVDGLAQTMATELAGDSAVLLTPLIKQRLAADLTGDKPITRVLDADGKPSALSIKELKEEFAKDSRFASIIIEGRGSGGGAAGNGNRGNGGAGAATNKAFKDLNEAERTAFYKRDKAGFEKAVQDEAAALRGV